MSISDAIKEAYSVAPADTYIVQTMELLHPAFVDEFDAADSIRVAMDNQSWNLTYETGAPLFAGQTKTFEPLAMQVSLPEQSESSLGVLNISIDNIPRDIWVKLQAASRVRASAVIIYREWIATHDKNDGSYSVSGPPDMILDQLTMKVVSASQLRIEGKAMFADLLNKQFPRRKFGRDDFPGLFGGN